MRLQNGLALLEDIALLSGPGDGATDSAARGPPTVALDVDDDGPLFLTGGPPTTAEAFTSALELLDGTSASTTPIALTSTSQLFGGASASSREHFFRSSPTPQHVRFLVSSF